MYDPGAGAYYCNSCGGSLPFMRPNRLDVVHLCIDCASGPRCAACGAKGRYRWVVDGEGCECPT